MVVMQVPNQTDLVILIRMQNTRRCMCYLLQLQEETRSLFLVFLVYVFGLPSLNETMASEPQCRLRRIQITHPAYKK